MKGLLSKVLEQGIVRSLGSVTSYDVSGDTLTLRGSGGVELVYERNPPVVDKPLEGIRWSLSGLAHDKIVSSSSDDRHTSVKFEDGQVSGSSGCNSYEGAYTASEGGVLTVNVTTITTVACLETHRAQREEEFLQALGSVTVWRVNGSRLELDSPTSGSSLRFHTS